MSFKDISIQKKLMRFIFLVSAIVLVTTSVTFFIYEFFTFRKTTVEKLMTIGKIISANSTAAIAFFNREDAAEKLSALQSEPHIVSACLYDKEGNLFSTYPAGLDSTDFPISPAEEGYFYTSTHVEIFLPVMQSEKQIGILYMKSDLDDIYSRFIVYTIISILTLVLSLLFAYLLSMRLKNSISKPILLLAETAKTITEKGDYSVRAIKSGTDELGQFSDAFNLMLAKIQTQNQSLNDFNKNLEKKVNDRTLALENVNKELHNSEQQIQSIFNSAPDAVIVINSDSIIEKWNQKAEKLFGWSFSEVVGKPIYDFIIPLQHREGHKNGMKRFLETGVGPVLHKEIDISAINKTGNEFDIQLSISPVTLKDKTLFIAFIRDITERKKVEKSLHLSEEKFNKAFQLSPAGIVISSLVTGNYLDVNESFLKIVGYNRDEVIGKSFNETTILSPESRKEILDELTKTASVQRKEVDIIKKSGQSGTMIFSSEQIEIAGEKCLLTIIYDISELKKAREDLKIKSEELARSNKELEQFAYIASHDLQEPLRMVNSYLQLLERRYKDKLDQDARDFINFAVDGSNRMRTLIFSLLDYSRVNRVKPFEDIKTNELLNEVLSDLKAQINENKAAITVEPLPDIYGDRVLMGQIFQNLISNAVKFKGDKDPEILISGKKNNHEYLFSIKDNGIGIQKEYAGKLFTIFQRLNTKDQYPGTGIGLAICKKIVEKHGGKIWFDSEFGKGSTFYFTIKAKEGNQSDSTTNILSQPTVSNT